MRSVFQFALVMTLGFTSLALSRALLPVPVVAQTEVDQLAIFDAHIHYNRDVWGLYSVDEALAVLDQAGVVKAFVSSTPDEGTLMLYERAPDRIVADLRPYRIESDQVNWVHDRSVIGYLEERLAEGTPYRGLGEFHLLAGQAGLDVPVALVSLGAQRGLVLHAHADAEALEQMLSWTPPDVKVLWAHAGMTARPSTVTRILGEHANVWVELALRTDVAPGGRLDADWAALFERFPDRFMIGTDTWIPSQWTRLPSLMNDVRTWLRQLSPDLAQAIAFQNAERLLDHS
jgi:hypothetical protein